MSLSIPLSLVKIPNPKEADEWASWKCHMRKFSPGPFLLLLLLKFAALFANGGEEKGAWKAELKLTHFKLIFSTALSFGQ